MELYLNNLKKSIVKNYDDLTENEIKKRIRMMHFNCYIINLTINGHTASYDVYPKIKYENLVNRLVKLKYSDSEEFAILRKSIGNPSGEEFIQYNNYVEECKIKAKEWIKERDALCA